MYIGSVTDVDFTEGEILDSFTLLFWYIHRFWKNLVKHIFPATKLIAETYPQIITKLPETLHYINDPNRIPQDIVNVPEKPSKSIKKLSINHQNVEIRNYNAETQPFSCTNSLENTNTSLEASSNENLYGFNSSLSTIGNPYEQNYGNIFQLYIVR